MYSYVVSGWLSSLHWTIYFKSHGFRSAAVVFVLLDVQHHGESHALSRRDIPQGHLLRITLLAPDFGVCAMYD